MINKALSLTRIKKWGKELAIMVLLLTSLSFAVDWYRSLDMPVGDAPSISAHTIEGLSIDILEQSQTEPVVLYFWATWCGACKFVSPTVNWLSNHYQIVSVALSSGSSERIRHYMTSKNYNFAVINDTTGEFSRQWHISVTPTIVIINKGQIESISTGVTTPVGLWLRILFAR
ncbi:protein disulfide oxidoreductase [Vibrio mediterranei]|uniref:protein disulfide oxidoreductase n=1 Tax=Vibrio mediterranei TaxID=689 RepID=UPI004067DCD6